MVSKKRGLLRTVINFIVGIPDLLADVVSYIFFKVAYIVAFISRLFISTQNRFFLRFIRFGKALHNRLGGALPRGTRSDVGRMIIYTGLTRNPEELLGIVLTYSLILPVMTSLIAITLGLPNLMIFFAAVVPFVFIWLFFYIFFVLLIDKRTTSVEKVLPDVLTMISQNMVAGMTTYNALWVAARPEFGPLAVEIQTVARETLSGESFEDALVAMSHRVKSYKLTRAVKLMVQGMRSGGELPTVLQEISSDIRTEQNLFKRMSADTTSQAMFILFALLIGAPLLLAASLQFVTMFNTIFSHVDPGESGAATAQIPISKLPIDGDFFTMYAIILLALSGLCGAILIGMMRTGKLSTGVPLTLLLVPLPVIIFIVLATLLGSFFGGLMAGV